MIANTKGCHNCACISASACVDCFELNGWPGWVPFRQPPNAIGWLDDLVEQRAARVQVEIKLMVAHALRSNAQRTRREIERMVQRVKAHRLACGMLEGGQ